MIWRIWYADRRTVVSENSAPADVHGYGVEVIAQPDHDKGELNVSYRTLHGFDWYYWHTVAERWMGCMSDSSLHSQILSRQPIVGICQGLLIPDERFQQILAEAKTWAADHGMRPKDGFRRGETPLE